MRKEEYYSARPASKFDVLAPDGCYSLSTKDHGNFALVVMTMDGDTEPTEANLERLNYMLDALNNYKTVCAERDKAVGIVKAVEAVIGVKL